MTVTKEDDASLTRTQKRLLRRIYNGRSIPIVADGKPFLTYADASRHLRSLGLQARDAAYAEMKEQAKSPRPDRQGSSCTISAKHTDHSETICAAPPAQEQRGKPFA